MVAIVVPKKSSVKPGGSARPSTTLPIVRLIGADVGSPSQVAEVCAGFMGDLTGTGSTPSYRWEDDDGDRVIRFDRSIGTGANGSSFYATAAGQSMLPTSQANFTLYAEVYLASGGSQVIFSSNDNGALELSIDSSNKVNLIRSNEAVLAVSTASIVPGAWNKIALSIDGTAVQFMVNGADGGTATATPACQNRRGFVGALRISNTNYNTISDGSKIKHIAVIDQSMSLQAMQALAADPVGHLYAPKMEPVFVNSVSNGANASLSQTLQSVSLSASATGNPSGSLNATLANATLSATADAVDASEEWILARGSNHFSQQTGSGPADRINIAGRGFRRPWTNWYDEANYILAPSQNGVAPAANNFVVMEVYGSTGGVDSELPLIEDGKQLMYYPSRVTSSLLVAQGFENGTLKDPRGVRGRGAISAHMTWQGHRTLFDAGASENPSPPGATTNIHMPFYIGLRVDNRFFYALRNGDCVEVGQIPGLAMGSTDFTFYPPESTIMFMVETEGGRVMKIDRSAARTAILPFPSGVVEDISLWSVTPLVTGLVHPTSCRCDDDGNLFVADQGAGKIYKYTFDGSHNLASSAEFCSLTDVFFLDVTSTGGLIAVTNKFNIHRITSAGVVGSSVTPAWLQSATTLDFVGVSVDRKGTMGPVDEFTAFRVIGPSNVETYKWDNSNNVARPFGAYNGGLAIQGPSTWAGEAMGHYPWGFWYHPDQAIVMAQGLINPAPKIIRPGRAGDPSWGYNHDLFYHGRNVAMLGTTAAAARYFEVPSFSCMISRDGGGILTYDDIVDMGWSGAASFIQAGMLGSFPRPEIVGYDLLAILYWAARNSQAYLEQGEALIADLYAWAAVNASLTPTTLPVDPMTWGQQYAAVYMEGTETGIVGRSIEEYPVSIEADVVIDVWANYGLSDEIYIGRLSQPWDYPTPLPFGTWGIYTQHVSGGTLTYRNRTTIVDSTTNVTQLSNATLSSTAVALASAGLSVTLGNASLYSLADNGGEGGGEGAQAKKMSLLHPGRLIG